MNSRRERSLLVQAYVQLALLAAGAIVLVGALTWFAWRYAVDAYAERLIELTRQHYLNQWAFQRETWLRATRRLRAQIEFMRLGELEPEVRRARLQAFFTAQGEERDFAAALLVAADGTPQFNLGCQALLQSGLDAMQFAPDTQPMVYLGSLCSEGREVYQLTHTALWLGRAGRGRLVLAQPLDNALLARLARSGDELYLVHAGRTVAASGGNERLRDRLDLALRPLQGDRLQVVIALAPADRDGPILAVRTPLRPPVTSEALAGAAGLAALTLVGLIWLGLGRQLRRELGRLASLTEAAGLFQSSFRRDADLERALGAARKRPDEIGRVGEALDRLMGEAEARQAEQLAYRQTLDMLDEAVLELDADGRILHASSAWPRLVGDEGAAAKPLSAYLHPEDAPVLGDLLARLVRGDKAQATARLRAGAGDGEERWLELRLARAPEGDRLRGVLRDITQTYLQERRITHMALHDALTGLPNRVLLEDRLKIALRLAGRSRHKVALGFIDLDHFKNVNDSLGHKTGDALLVALAQRLRHSLRAGDTLSRWGGDEFVVLLPELPDAQAAREAVAKLRAAAEQPLVVEDTEFNVTFSAGFALYPDDAEDGDVLLAHADRAMFYAKAQGRNAVQFYADMTRKGLGRKEVYLQQRLVAAVREGRIVNHYQPLVAAATRRPHGVEALARWYEEDLGWVSPATFIPMAENLGLIRELGEQVWRRALRDLKLWRSRGIGLSINISKRQLFKPYFTEHLVKDLDIEGIEPSAITLEITESLAIMDVEHSFDRLKELHAAGFRLSIDDFGTGYSSLSQLHELPVQELKIDIEFVRRLKTERGQRLILTIVELAESLGLATVAEGVEDAESAQRLADMGVNTLQGWYCGRPMTAEALTQWLEGAAP